MSTFERRDQVRRLIATGTIRTQAELVSALAERGISNELRVLSAHRDPRAVAEAMLDLLNAGLTPVVPEHGSLGASGDLAHFAHLRCGDTRKSVAADYVHDHQLGA